MSIDIMWEVIKSDQLSWDFSCSVDDLYWPADIMITTLFNIASLVMIGLANY